MREVQRLFKALVTLLCIAAQQLTVALSMPKMRNFLQLPGSFGSTLSSLSKYDTNIRVLQFNVLADGLAGLRKDLGKFSRANSTVLSWEYRKNLLIKEISQYEPDIITLQEVDHYHDFFLPELNARGYRGFFAPKPTSACLDVSNRSDGCCLFVKKNKLRIISCETKTLALSKAELSSSGELLEDEKNILAQNQVALIAVCELLPRDKNETDENNMDEMGYPFANVPLKRSKIIRNTAPPPIIVSTTHLKSSKTNTGERYRQRGITQVLDSIYKIYRHFAKVGKTPALILSGDFNAIPGTNGYEPLTYRTVKQHRLNLRSVYNEDVSLSPISLSDSELYSTWKARNRNNEEVEIKRCIDYIFYSSFEPSTIKKNGFNGNNGKKTEIEKDYENKKMNNNGVNKGYVASSSAQIAVSALLRFSVYFFGALIPLTSLISEHLTLSERASILLVSIVGLYIFEVSAEGSIFRPQLAADLRVGTIYSELSENDIISDAKKIRKKFKEKNENKNKFKNMKKIQNKGNNNIIKSIYDVDQESKKKFTETFILSVASIGQQLQPLPQESRPGFKALTALDVYSPEEIGPNLIPSLDYPSDHLAIVADLELLW